MKFTESPLLSQLLPAWRARCVFFLLMGGFLVLMGRSVYLQSVHEVFLQKKGESRYSRVIELPATRGRILDRNGQVLAVSTLVKSIWAIPGDVKMVPAQRRILARSLDMNEEELNRRLALNDDFVYLKRQLAPDVADKVAALNFPGIHQQAEYRRYYPAGEVAAHMLGFTGAEDRGQEGIELALEDELAGKPGSRRVIKDRRGHIVEDDIEGRDSMRVPQDGHDVRLALDSAVQYLAYAHLAQAIKEFHAKAGGIVVLDVKTGEVLALANLPTYNPNNRDKLSGTQLRNRALTDAFEPGSTLKPFTVALGLEQGSFQFNTPVQTAPGRLTIGRATISDAHPHGILTVAEIIQKSSNVGAAKIAATLTPQSMWEMLNKVGFGSVIKLGFPGEVGGKLRPYKSWKPIEQATMSYGHGISVSLMQLARAYLVFAREGDVIPLSLTRLQEGAAPVGKQVFSAQTARSVRDMLEMVVQPEGTAPKARVPGYRVAGKTGTAYKVEGRIYTNHYISSFVGLAPASNPRLIVAVMIDDPSGVQHYGGDVAAPVFSHVMGGALRSLGIKPDAENSAKPIIVARQNVGVDTTAYRYRE